MLNAIEMIGSNHKEIIHDISFNYYGNRLATCSSDQKIMIYE
jgi:nucleoporin SEH1